MQQNYDKWYFERYDIPSHKENTKKNTNDSRTHGNLSFAIVELQILLNMHISDKNIYINKYME